MSRLIVFAPLQVISTSFQTSTARAVLKAYHRLRLSKQTSMTFPHVRAVKLSGETFGLDGNLEKIGLAL